MTSKRHIYLDIETAPTDDPLVREQLAADIHPPGNYSKPETIAAWEADKKPALVDEAVKRTALDGALGAIAVIGVAFGDDEPVAFFEDGTRPHNHEPKVLRAFFQALEAQVAKNYRADPIFVGHCVTEFDLRFIFQRAVILGIKPPACIPFMAKPWDSTVFDTMARWAGVRGSIKLDKLARALGLPGKQGMDGSQVADAIAAGQIAKVADYCTNVDVRQVRDIHRRMTFTTCDAPDMSGFGLHGR